MALQSINLMMEGPEENNRHLELSVFTEQLRQFQQLLSSILKKSEHTDVVVQIVNLAHSSPAVIECQPILNGSPDAGAVQSIRGVFDGIESGQADDLHNDILTAFEKLTKPVPNKIAWRKITTTGSNIKNKKAYNLDETFMRKLEHVRGREYSEISTLDGVLEEINVHGTPYACKIYDAGVNSATIKCAFPDELLDKVQAALGCNVFVSGDFSYRLKDNIPYEIFLHKIEILPPSDQLPSLGDLKGIAPGLTGAKTAEEFVRELRDSWN